ncbi:MAG: hypothetical protein LC772_02990, partial [Chloroflexi bacterium]|nr:hypothetical protein [Chloroflexota bacterium]
MRLTCAVWLFLLVGVGFQTGCNTPAAAGTGTRIEVLGALPPATGAASAASVQNELKRSGWAVRTVTGDEFGDARQLSASDCDLLVVPDSSVFPASALPNLVSYLRSGGKLLCLGGPPFTKLVYRSANDWMTWDKLAAHIPSDSTLTGSEGAAQWTLSGSDVSGGSQSGSDGGGHPSVSSEQGPEGFAVHLALPRFTDWDYISLPPFASSPYLARDNLLVFWAKGDEKTRSLVVEWRERDGSRWIGSVSLTPEWKRYAMSPPDFRYWADNPSKGRGGPGDRFRPANASGLSVGLANASAPEPSGPKNLWVADLGVARSPGARSVAAPVLESLSPVYKLRDARPGAWEPIRRFLAATPVNPPGRLSILRSVGERPLAWMYRPNTGAYAGAVWGASVDGRDLPDQVRTMLATLWVTHAGAASACFRRGEPATFLAGFVNRGAVSRTVRATLRVWPVSRSGGTGTSRPAVRPVIITAVVPPRASRTFRIRWPGALSPGGQSYSMDFSDVHPAPAGAFTDRFSDRFTVLPERSHPGPLVEARRGAFVLDGRPWRVVGINYFPLSVVGEDPGAFQRDWLRPEFYDPAMAETDLALMQRLRINAVSVLYLDPAEGPPLDDFLARCRVHGIRANVFLGGGNPLASDTRMLIGLISAAHLAANDAVFAYDLAWEPHVGSHPDRKRLDPEWLEWVLENYGSVTRAEQDWGMSAPRDDGRLTNPADQQLMQDGPWRRMVAAYRRFMDDRISHGYRDVCSAIRDVDPRHLLGARSGWGGNG